MISGAYCVNGSPGISICLAPSWFDFIAPPTGTRSSLWRSRGRWSDEGSGPSLDSPCRSRRTCSSCCPHDSRHSGSARPPLLVIAASSQPTVELVLAVVGSDGSHAGLAQAEATGIVERADGRLRFSHPLLASTVYLNAAPRERRALHLRLADLVVDPEERARHLALAAEEPDTQVAQALEEAARHARARAAPDAAADLADLARLLTPPEEVRRPPQAKSRRRRVSLRCR